MAWIMHSDVRHRPWCLTFYIGSIEIAKIEFENKKPILYTWDQRHGPFGTVSAAMTRMHELLNSPPVIAEPANADD
jgi:hypothetical protein